MTGTLARIRLNKKRAARGFSIIEAIIAVSLILVVFLGFFGAYSISAESSWNAKARMAALGVMAEKIEYIRDLDYANVGTPGGSPAGVVPVSEQKTVSGVPYTVSTAVMYRDDPRNGTGTNDYKVVRVAVSWNLRSVPLSISSTTYVAP